ncbi:hypothetical protein KBY67_07665 [Synechococcus sp. RedBA-s]|nr:hypothetical protein [Synechococcus sp. RedBA-s]
MIKNLARLEAISAVAASHQVQLLAFPELSLCGYALSPDTAWRLTEPLNGPSLQLVAGRECLYDAIGLFDSGGTLLRNFRKTHLWGPDEALVNCYEGEFPELTRLLVLAGARLVLIPTAANAWMLLCDGRRTDRPYPDVSRTLLPAHAFSSQSFAAKANRCGEESVGEQVWGPTWATAWWRPPMARCCWRPAMSSPC